MGYEHTVDLPIYWASGSTKSQEKEMENGKQNKMKERGKEDVGNEAGWS